MKTRHQEILGAFPIRATAAIFLLVLTGSCAKKSGSALSELEETAQQVGEVLASIDEAGKGTGLIAANGDGAGRTFRRLGYGPGVLDSILPQAIASVCGLSTFGSCSGNSIVRDFAGCSLGIANLTGTVTLTWGGSSANCTLGAVGDTITRVPEYTATGLRGANLAVTKSGAVGQRLTWVSGSGTSKVFEFTNDGIRRVFTEPAGTVLFDLTAETLSPITVTGTLRSSRTVSGGSLRVTNNVSGVTCDFAPTSVSWSNMCNCPVSGTWSASCSDGRTSSLTHTGCGTANFTLGADSRSVTFDRCAGI